MAGTFMMAVGGCGCGTPAVCTDGICAYILKYASDADWGHDIDINHPNTRPCGVCTTKPATLTMRDSNGDIITLIDKTTGNPIPTQDNMTWDGATGAFRSPCIWLTNHYTPAGVDLGPMGGIIRLYPANPTTGYTLIQFDHCPVGGTVSDDTSYHLSTGNHPYTCDITGLHAHWIPSTSFMRDYWFYLGATDIYVDVPPFLACHCPGECFCFQNLPETVTATYAGKTYQLIRGVHGSLGNFTGWANDIAVALPSTQSTGSVLAPCTDGCGNNGDVPSRLLMDQSCNISLALPRSCACPTTTFPNNACWFTGDLWSVTQLFPLGGLGVTGSCTNGVFLLSTTVPATLVPDCAGTALATPGGGGPLQISGELDLSLKICCTPCNLPQGVNLQGTAVFDPSFHIANSVFPMTYNANLARWYGFVPVAGQPTRPAYEFFLSCGNLILRDPFSGNTCSGSDLLFWSDWTCNPLHLHYKLNNGTLLVFECQSFMQIGIGAGTIITDVFFDQV